MRRCFSFLAWSGHHNVERKRYLDWAEWDQANKWFVGETPEEASFDIDEAYDQAMETYRKAFGITHGVPDDLDQAIEQALMTSRREYGIGG